MRRTISLSALGPLLVLFIAADPEDQEQKAAPAVSPYVRTMRGAIRRVQQKVEKSTDLWKDHSRWEDAWRVRSGPYIVRTTHSRRLGLDIGQKLEFMLEEFKFVLKPDFTPEEPFQVYIFPVLAQYNQFGEEFGEYHSSIYGSFHAAGEDKRPVAILYNINDTLLVMFATHSALHQFIDRAFSQAPPVWISEGLASYFAHLWAYAWGVSQLKELIDGDRFIPLAQLLQTPIDQYGENAHAYFTELGMLCYYLLNFREDTCMTEEDDGAFVTYLRALLSGQNITSLPFHDLVTRRLGELEADFKAFAWPTE